MILSFRSLEIRRLGQFFLDEDNHQRKEEEQSNTLCGKYKNRESEEIHCGLLGRGRKVSKRLNRNGTRVEGERLGSIG